MSREYLLMSINSEKSGSEVAIALESWKMGWEKKNISIIEPSEPQDWLLHQTKLQGKFSTLNTNLMVSSKTTIC